MVVILVLVAVLLGWLFIKPYVQHYDTVIAYTGGLGSGKSLCSVQMTKRLWRKNRAKWLFKKIRHPIKYKDPLPKVYSSIPLKLGFGKFAIKLTEDHLLLRAKIDPLSVVFIDEVDAFASQFDYNLPNVLENFNEFVRFFRHYTKGGYLVVNTQCSDNIVLQIRRRINTVLNMMHFKKWFWVFYTVKVRNISISEEVKTMEEGHAEDNHQTMFGFIPVFSRPYDTYCYSERYATVPKAEETTYTKLKMNHYVRCPRKKIYGLTNDVDSIEQDKKPSFLGKWGQKLRKSR